MVSRRLRTLPTRLRGQRVCPPLAAHWSTVCRRAQGSTHVPPAPLWALRATGGARHRPLAARRGRVEPTACAHGALGRLLHRLHRIIFGRVDDAGPLATALGDERRPLLV